MADLDIRLLGTCAVHHDGESVDIGGPRVQSLLGYLILHRGSPQARRRVAGLFWPDTTHSQSLTNLRQCLHHLRQALPDADRCINADFTTLQWRPDAPCRVDVVQFTTLLDQADTEESAAARQRLQQAVDLYRGSLLPDCDQAWITGARQRLGRRYTAALERLIALLEERRQTRGALETARALVAHDPLNEGGYRHVMRLLAVSGRRARALKTYHTCSRRLQRELGVTPSTETRDLYEAILNRTVDPAGAAGSGDTAESGGDLVGRRDAWQTLHQTWQKVHEGTARFVLLQGEAGIGKTRLARDLLAWAGRQGITAAEARAYPTGGWLVFGPVAEWLRRRSLFDGLGKMETVWLRELARLLPELLTQYPDIEPPSPLTEPWQRQRFFEALARAIPAEREPVVLLLDDLQWAASEMLEWLGFLLHVHADRRLLVVGTTRPEGTGPTHPLHQLAATLQGRGQMTAVDLGPLSADETRRLAASLAGTDVSAEQGELLRRRTGGNPLFVEEVVRAGLLRGDDEGADPAAVPPRIRSVIQQRLQHLSPEAGRTARAAAAAGGTFRGSLVAEVTGDGDAEAVQALEELLSARIVTEVEEGEYTFYHDYLRELVYRSLSAARRRLLHRRLAEALEEQRGEKGPAEGGSGRVAVHYERAGLPEKAISHYRRAARDAQRVYANRRAVARLRKSLSLLEGLPSGDERERRELECQLALGVSLVATKGYASRDVGEAYRRAQTLCRRLGEPVRPPVLRALAIHRLLRGDLEDAFAFGERLLTTSHRADDDAARVEGHYVLGVTRFWRGQFRESRKELERALALYSAEHRRTHLALYSQDPEPICGIRLAYGLWFQGLADEARRRAERAVEAAEQLGHPFTRAYTLVFAALMYNELGQAEERDRHAATAGDLSDAHNVELFRDFSTMLRGWSLASGGSTEEGIDALQQALDQLDTSGHHLLRPYALGWLGATYTEAGEPQAALEAVDRALDRTGGGTDHFWTAELLRIKGRIAASAGDVRRGAALLRQAIDTAEAQQAPALTLRVLTTLGGLATGADVETEPGPGAAGFDGADDLWSRLSQLVEEMAQHGSSRDLDRAIELLRTR